MNPVARWLALVALINAAGAARNAYLGDWGWFAMNVGVLIILSAAMLLSGLGRMAKEGDHMAPERDEEYPGQNGER
jgi:hypothetical protein